MLGCACRVVCSITERIYSQRVRPTPCGLALGPEHNAEHLCRRWKELTIFVRRPLRNERGDGRPTPRIDMLLRNKLHWVARSGVPPGCLTTVPKTIRSDCHDKFICRCTVDNCRQRQVERRFTASSHECDPNGLHGQRDSAAASSR